MTDRDAGEEAPSFDDFVRSVAAEMQLPLDIVFPDHTMAVLRDAYESMSDAVRERLDPSWREVPSAVPIDSARDIDVFLQLRGRNEIPFGEPLGPFRMQAIPAVADELGVVRASQGEAFTLPDQSSHWPVGTKVTHDLDAGTLQVEAPQTSEDDV